ncbi:MAG TPA: RidA family protein [Flavitalea sp.]|nr:RidA family protein [Flavitalea sp.]
MSLLENLIAAGVELNTLPKPGGSYVAVNVRGTTATVAIQSPIEQNKFLYTGVLGKDISTEEGYKAARICAINVLKQINHYINEEDFVGLNHVDIMYQCTGEWDEGPAVANGASDAFIELLGEKGTHTRSICGVFRLPKQFCVTVVTSFTVLEGTVVKK